MTQYSNDADFLKEASKIIHNNRIEFEEYKKTNSKLYAVKLLKEYMNCGLKESKDAIDLYWVNKLPHFILEERKKKLEKLAKKPLVEELIIKLRKNDDILNDILMKLSIDELMDIDELLTENR